MMRSRWPLWFLALFVASSVCSQQQPATGGTPAPGAVVPVVPPQALDPMHLNPTWVPRTRQPTFTGFPVFPSGLSGYGSYPAPAGVGATPAGSPIARMLGGTNRPLPPLLELLARRGPLTEAPADTGWPNWARLRDREPLPFAADLALLVRHSERVWWRANDDEPFVPLAFHDKFRTLAAGAMVEVRQTGDYELLLHDTGRVVALGASRVRLLKLGTDEAAVQVDAFTRMRLFGTRRAHRFVLPDGSTLRWAASTPADEGMAAEVHLDRATAEPGWLGGRATITNYGDREVVWQHAFGEVVLAPGWRTTFFLQPSTTAMAAALTAQDVRRVEDRDAFVGTATADGEVRWCGARFQLPAGSSLRLEPLSGQPFAPGPSQP